MRCFTNKMSISLRGKYLNDELIFCHLVTTLYVRYNHIDHLLNNIKVHPTNLVEYISLLSGYLVNPSEN